MKTCKTCCKEKSLLDFNVKKSSPDGRATRCRACSKNAQAVYRAENSEKLKERQAAYRRDNPDKLKERKAADYRKRAEEVKKKSADWYSSNKAKALASAKKRYELNPEPVKDSSRKYRLLNQGLIKVYQEKYRIKNLEKSKKYSAAWRAVNKRILRAHRQNRRAKLKLVGGKLTAGLAGNLLKLQQGKCACCGHPLGDDYHMDHIMPLALGGTNTDDNIQLLRAKCNMQKSAKHPIDFMRERGFLL
jgi:5-methylcytosine-specific restriction endonuclease McrA